MASVRITEYDNGTRLYSRALHYRTYAEAADWLFVYITDRYVHYHSVLESVIKTDDGYEYKIRNRNGIARYLTLTN